MCYLPLLLALWELGRLFFFFLYHSVCFKPCDLHGCRHHLLSVLAYNSWLDLGLFFSCDAGSRQHVVNPSPGLAPAPKADIAASPITLCSFARQSPSLPFRPACLLKHRAVSKDPFSSVCVGDFFNTFFLFFCFVTFFCLAIKKKKARKRRY